MKNTDDNILIYHNVDNTLPSYKEFIDPDNFTDEELIREQIYIPKGGCELPKNKNYDDGYILRYFYRQANNKKSIVRELSSSEYKSASRYFLYKTLVLKWKIIGNKDDTTKINKNIISLADQTMPGISSVLWNPLEYWKDIADPTPVVTDVTSRYVTQTQLVEQYSVLAPSQLGTTDYEMYLLSQDYIVLLTQDYVGILVENNT